MKVLMFVSNPITSDPRVYSEARSLTKAGYGVTVIGYDRQGEHPSQENVDGIDIIRVRPSFLPNCGFGSVLSTGLSLLLWQLLAYRRALALNMKRGFDVVHCHDLDTLTIGVRLKRKLKVSLIYDAHEIYGYMMTRHFPHRMAYAFLWLEKWLVRHVDQIVTVVEPLKTYFQSITEKPISMVMNCKPLQTIEYEPPDGAASFTILYIGALHGGRGVPMLVDAVAGLPGVQCIVGGIGNPKYVRRLKEKCDAVANAQFIGRVPMDEVVPMTKKADVVFLMVNPRDPNNRIGLGNKQFEAMVCGRPIICTKGTYSGDLTEQEEVGLTVEYDTEALKQAIVRLRDDSELREKLGRNALQAAINKYNWEKQEEKLIELYKSIRPSLD